MTRCATLWYLCPSRGSVQGLEETQASDSENVREPVVVYAVLAHRAIAEMVHV